jgi:hypothetical protein
MSSRVTPPWLDIRDRGPLGNVTHDHLSVVVIPKTQAPGPLPGDRDEPRPVYSGRFDESTIAIASSKGGRLRGKYVLARVVQRPSFDRFAAVDADHA